MSSGMNWKSRRSQSAGVIGSGNDIAAPFKLTSKAQELRSYEHCLAGGQFDVLLLAMTVLLNNEDPISLEAHFSFQRCSELHMSSSSVTRFTKSWYPSAMRNP